MGKHESISCSFCKLFDGSVPNVQKPTEARLCAIDGNRNASAPAAPKRKEILPSGGYIYRELSVAHGLVALSLERPFLGTAAYVAK